MLTPLSALACEDWVAKVVAVEGAVQHKHGQQDWQPLQREQHICPGGSVKVGDNSRASLHLRNNTFTRLDADSLLSFPVQTQERRFWVELRQGIAHFISRIVHEFEVSTPYVNAVVEGTEFVVAAQQGQGAVSVMEGKVTAYNEKSRASLTAGQQAVSGGRDLDLSRFNVPADTLVEWAIHYPPVLSLAELPTQTAQDKAALQQAIAALQQNRVDQALQILEDAPASDVVQLARGTLLLQIGRMPEFTRTIEPLLQGPASGLAHGLKSIAAIARNDIASGRASADIAVQRAPNSAAAWIALSYAQQAELQLNAALESARKATQVQPASLLAHLRLSELHLAQGDVDAARDALEAVPDGVARGAELEGSKGFVQLFRLKLDSAREHFNRALAMDSSNPQYQLGLGLTLLRDGDLKAGRQHMEYAVSLDPLRSVLRSYLGRAYFEEKRDDVALEQWQLAKQFDPNDPTPYFYTGVHKLFANDPIGAVEELETSRDLNDKRAIYRSETLLQSDAASRSATLARAYGEVGYDQGVLLSGWDALRRDPTNSEGHRLLADYYAGDPRYETARVSELLQSQLWQPLSAYPLQPQLSEANLAVVAGAGPQRPGFNEYHSLFTQDGAYGMVNGYGGSDGTWGNDLVGSVLAGPVALSLGQYHYESDGWRENADQEQDIYNGLVQWQVGPGTSLQFESRKLTWDKGDLTINWEGELSQIAEQEFISRVNRIGLSQKLGAKNVVLVSIVDQMVDDSVSSESAIGLQNFGREKEEPTSIELQLVNFLSRGYLQFGVGRTDSKLESEATSDFSGFLILDETEGSDSLHENVYAYWTSSLWGLKTVEVGAAYDRFKSDRKAIDNVLSSSTELSEKYHQWSPKLGLSFDIGQQSVARIALFRTLYRQVAANQTLEPTHIVGFNQRYEEFAGTDSKNLVMAIDVARDSSFRYGMGFQRQLDDFPFDDAGTLKRIASRESDFNVYADYFIGAGWAINLGYREWRYDANIPSAIDQLSEIETRLVPIAATKNIGSYFQIAIKQTYYDQVYVIPVLDMDLFEARDVTFNSSGWITDFALKQLMPGRLGFIELGISNAFDANDQVVASSRQAYSFYPARFAYLQFQFNI